MIQLALMYHIVVRSQEERRALLNEEQPYALLASEFEQQLALIKQLSLSFMSATVTDSEEDTENKGVLLTFDDGHASFMHQVLPLLQQFNASAIFFVSPGLMKSRTDFVSRQQLRHCSEQGVVIGSHAWSHQFLPDLSESQLKIELADSKMFLEDACSAPVTQLSFPGGRYGKREIDMAMNLGFKRVFTSDIGLIASASDFIQPRFAIRQNTSAPELTKILSGDAHYLKMQQREHQIKALARSVFGHRNYDRLYRLFTKNS